MKAKKLPSGNGWIVTVYAGKDPATGKTKQKSFTGLTKAEAERKAAQFTDQRKRQKWNDPTVGEALAGYIAAKEAVLSPSTVRGYVRMQRNNFSRIESVRLRDLTQEDLQLFVSDLSRRLSSKTVHNVFALLTASIGLYAPDLHFKVTLPAKQKKKQISPSDETVAALYEAASPTIKLCIALAAFGSLRRGEICALKYRDIDGNTVHIHADMVQDKNGKWIYKDIPKTDESNRIVTLPDAAIKLLGSGDPNDFVIPYKTPGSISRVFLKLRNRFGLDIRFHDLRHYYASIGAVLGIPSLYLAEFGGWSKSSPIMQDVYQHQIEPMKAQYSAVMKEHFEKIVK